MDRDEVFSLGEGLTPLSEKAARDAGAAPTPSPGRSRRPWGPGFRGQAGPRGQAGSFEESIFIIQIPRPRLPASGASRLFN